MSNNQVTEKKKNKRIKTSDKILFFTLVVIVYLLGRAISLNEPISNGLAVGMIIGFGIGAKYMQVKIKEMMNKIKEDAKNE